MKEICSIMRYPCLFKKALHNIYRLLLVVIGRLIFVYFMEFKFFFTYLHPGHDVKLHPCTFSLSLVAFCTDVFIYES